MQANPGKLLLLTTNAGALRLSWSNDGGSSWSGATGPKASTQGGVTWLLGGDTTLDAFYRTAAGISYQQFGLTRATDGSNDVLAIATVGLRVELDTPSGSPRPSAVLDKNVYPDVAWIHAGTDSGRCASCGRWPTRRCGPTG
ncbi:MAG: hypothetical protein HY690_13110 [Chloroflexi bacterium]|nr:hypothetical protein [Chloroflexota bacterium]